MAKMLFPAALAAVLATSPISGSAKAQVLEEWQSCLGAGDAPAGLRISGCTLVIQSGQANPQQLAVAYGRACDAHLDRGFPTSAIAYCDEAVARDPGGALHWYSRARARSMKRDYQRACRF
jgi:hypothetical protein